MKYTLVIAGLIGMPLILSAQILREFSADTAQFRNELVTFTGNTLESSEVPDFERFLHLYDSLPHERRKEIIEVSNLMLDRRCRPRPHFIAYQRTMMEFFYEDKTSHGYEEWLDGLRLFLKSEIAIPGMVDQWLTVSLTLLEENIFYESVAVTWKVATPSFTFHTDSSMAVLFEDVTVACYSGRDFIQIRDASGYIDPVSLEWFGTRGRVTWERVGIPPEEMQAYLGSYRINLKTPGYSADSVTLFYPARFEGKVIGMLEDKVTLIKELRQAKYPQFTSYQNSYRIEDFAPGVNYRGGLKVEGMNLVGSGVEGELAQIEIFSRDTLRLRATTQRATLNDQMIRSRSASVSIYFADDSLYHPDLILTYDIAGEQLRLNKSEDFTSMGPYSNSYHGMDMNFDELFWTRGQPTMIFQAMQGSTIGRASFESSTFFDYTYYTELQGMDFVNPLAQLYMYSNSLGGRKFSAVPYAAHIGYPEYQVRHLLMGLSKQGFLYYDDETDLITLRQKLFDYIDAATKKRDYDVIRFISRTEQVANAEFDLSSRDLKIRGIPVIFLSDSQNVRLVPRGNQITMKRNRSFAFNGVVDAGMFRITGENFFFDYDSFRISLAKIDSLQISVPTGRYNQYGQPIGRQVDNAIEHMKGELLIDRPQNKSGLEDHPRYPVFTSTENSYIYFDREDIQNGVYSRDEFYFELDPFEIDSLDNFSPEAVSPSGTFVSAGILPPLERNMTLRPDNSLGFYMQAPEDGIPLYGGLGRFYEDIEMSSHGLHGYGAFDFLTSTTWSDDFVMHPDSMMATSRRFLVRERPEAIEFPYVENSVADITFFPGEEKLRVNRVEETFRIFTDSIFHGGDLALTPSGLTGKGVMALPEARIGSDRFSYGSATILADSAGVEIREPTMDEFPFLTSDVQLRIDLDARMADMTANADQTLVEFPYNLYETRLDHVGWNMDEGELALSQKKDLPENQVDIGIDSLKRSGPTYVSLHPDQDELSFVAPEAVYDYRSRLLRARRVPFIEVADAYIFPHNGAVEIGYQATMGMLEDARVLASRQNRQHLIFDASISIHGAKDYTGSGAYNYTDAFGNDYRVDFNRIWVDTTLQTRSSGEVGEDDPFMLSPFFDFQGTLTLEAGKPLLTFDGGTRLMHDCNIGRAWLRFNAELDPTDIRIPVPEQKQNTDLNKIFAGTMITRDSAHIYSTFLSGRKDYFDANITTASGILLYEPDQARYIISGSDKMADTTLPGHYLRLETRSCEVYGEGPLTLNLDYGQVKLVSSGNARHHVVQDEFTARMVLGMDFHFSEDALQVMGGEIDSLPDLEPVDLRTDFYSLAMKDLLGEEQALKLEQELALTGMYTEIPEQWRHTIFFNDLPLRWNQFTRSFRYSGKVGIGNIGDVQVNKKMDAYIEFVERGSGDVFDIYLEADRNTWYYIAYSPGGLQVLSSNRRFNDIVYELRASERRVRAGPGEPRYVYSLAAQRRMELFINRFLEVEEQQQEEDDF